MTLQDKVREWLESSGFPLEMRTAAAFRAAGFDVRQSGTYADPESGKGREIDVVASDPDIVGAIEISFIAECKSSDKPWIVLTSNDAFANYNRLHAFAVMSDTALESLASRIPNLPPSIAGYIKRPMRGGYAIRQAFVRDNDPGYSAAITVAKACKDFTIAERSVKVKRLMFAFPVVVIDSPLFECTLTPDGQLELVAVESTEFLFLAHIPEPLGCSIKVVTEGYLPQFAQHAKQIADVVRTDLQGDEDRIVKSWGRR